MNENGGIMDCYGEGCRCEDERELAAMREARRQSNRRTALYCLAGLLFVAIAAVLSGCQSEAEWEADARERLARRLELCARVCPPGSAPAVKELSAVCLCVGSPLAVVNGVPVAVGGGR